MWNAKRSLLLSKVCTILAMAFLVVMVASGPQGFLRAAVGISYSALGVEFSWWPAMAVFFVPVYMAYATLAVLLVLLYMLLHNIGKGQVFVEKNVSFLRYISWCCFLGAAEGVASSFLLGFAFSEGVPLQSWYVVSAAAAFVGLIVRVVKNVFQQAVALQQESDLTV